MTVRWLPFRLRSKPRLLTDVFWNIISKLPLNSYSPTELFKIFSQFWFINFFWFRAKSNPFSRIFIYVSVKTFELKLKVVSEHKYPPISLLLLFVSDDEFCCKSCRIESNSSSCEEKTMGSFWLICLFALLETSAEFVHRSGEPVPELEGLLFSHANNSQFLWQISSISTS